MLQDQSNAKNQYDRGFERDLLAFIECLSRNFYALWTEYYYYLYVRCACAIDVWTNVWKMR